VDYYESMTAETTLSCADLDQTMAINTMMAVTMFGVIQNFYYAKPISFYRVNVSLSHGSTPEYINTNYLVRTSAKRQFCNKDAKSHSQVVHNAAIDANVNKFYYDIFIPFNESMSRAERSQKLQVQQDKEAEHKRVGEAAVAKAMLEYGWKKPASEFMETPPEGSVPTPVELRVPEVLNVKPKKAAAKKVKPQCVTLDPGAWGNEAVNALTADYGFDDEF
jgi:hypothetical protein